MRPSHIKRATFISDKRNAYNNPGWSNVGYSGQANTCHTVLVVSRQSNRKNRNNEADDRRRIGTHPSEPIEGSETRTQQLLRTSKGAIGDKY